VRDLDSRRSRRRRFGFWAIVFGVLWGAAGTALAPASGVFGTLGLAVLAQGIGLVVAGVWLAFGHNPLVQSNRNHRR